MAGGNPSDGSPFQSSVYPLVAFYDIHGRKEEVIKQY
jgi:hypothetical protein